jgi:exonuclease III
MQISVRRNKEGHHILIKGTIQQEDMTILNIYALNIEAPIFIKQILLSLKEQIGLDSMIVGDLNIPLSSTDRMSRQKINKDVLELNNTLDKMDLVDIYRLLHPMTADYTFFSAAHGTFSKTDHILDHNANLNKYKKKKLK